MNKTADVVLSAEDVKMLSHLIDNVQRAAQDNNPKTVIACCGRKATTAQLNRALSVLRSQR